MFVYRSPSSIPSYIDHSCSIFFFYLITCFITLFCLFFAYFLILLLLQCNDPTPQTHALLLRFCGYHRQTEIYVTASCACFVGPDHDPFGGCVGSASTAFPSYLIYWMPTRSLEVQSTSIRHSFLMTVLLPPQRPLLHTFRLSKCCSPTSPSRVLLLSAILSSGRVAAGRVFLDTC